MPDVREFQKVVEAAEKAAAAGDLATAEALLREAAELQEASHGPLHPDLASTFNNLAVVCEMAHKPIDAEQFYRRAYSIASWSLSPGHPMVATARDNLRDFCVARGLPLEEWMESADRGPHGLTAATRAGRRSNRARCSAAGAGAAVGVRGPRGAGRFTRHAAVTRAVGRPGLADAAARQCCRAATGRAARAARSRGGGRHRGRARRHDHRPPGAHPGERRRRSFEPGREPRRAHARPGARGGDAPRRRPGGPCPCRRGPARACDPAGPNGRASRAHRSTRPRHIISRRVGSAGGAARGERRRVHRAHDRRGVAVYAGRGDHRARTAVGTYTRVASPRGLRMRHRWYQGDRLRQDVALTIGANAAAGYRTFSRQTVTPGEWRVELRADNGTVVTQTRFVVQ